MIEIRYSDAREIDLSGIWKNIEELRQEILRFIQSDSKKLSIKTETKINPEPWDSAAKGLEMVIQGERIKISIADNVLLIEGSKENLEKFSSFLAFDNDAVSGIHTHFEYYDGNELIASDSIPLVIGIK